MHENGIVYPIDIQNVVSMVKRMQRSHTTADVMRVLDTETLHLPMKTKQRLMGLCVAAMAENMDSGIFSGVDLVEGFVYFTTMMGVVVMSWWGYTGLCYYACPILITCGMLFACVNPYNGGHNHYVQEETGLLGDFLSTNAESLLYFYCLQSLRVMLPCIKKRVAVLSDISTDLLPSGELECLVCRGIVKDALYSMHWRELCIVQNADFLPVLRHMVKSLGIARDVNGEFDKTYRDRRMGLIVAIAERQRYPSSDGIFTKRRWEFRITRVLQELRAKGDLEFQMCQCKAISNP
jgi:hypothetical protein